MLSSEHSSLFQKQKQHKQLSTTGNSIQNSKNYVHEVFIKNLVEVLNDPTAKELQCSLSTNKPCDCICKYILNGTNWKAQVRDLERFYLSENNLIKFTEPQLVRARELLKVFHVATELKKEKSYDANSSEERKTVKELRGAIGLGNGRKRSKRYEDFVLETRQKLRETYCLCEKAAKKLLGYSINFLYKKLRTNPEKMSRIVATNKTDQTPKHAKQALSIAELKDRASKREDHCCARLCIQKLMFNKFDKIVEWRKRLDGCTQRVAQEIIAEVLQAAGSMDGPESFCQTIVHWITGCSFKKIRRVRDHLKKDPKSLPEHGLKVYWKNKGQKQLKPGEKIDISKDVKNSTFSTNQATFSNPLELSTLKVQSNLSSNYNNNNNRDGGQVEYSIQPLESVPNQMLSYPVGITPEAVQNASNYQQQQYNPTPFIAFTQSDPSIYMTGGANVLSQGFEQNVVSVDTSTVISNPSTFPVAYEEAIESANNSAGDQTNMQILDAVTSIQQTQQTSTYSNVQNNNQVNYALTQAGEVVYPSSDSASVEFGSESIHPYIVAANNGSLQQEHLYQPGLTPLLVAQTSESSESDQGLSWNSQFSGQPFFLFSPTTLNNNNGGKLDIDNWSQIVPITPVNMHPGTSSVDSSHIPSSVTPVAIMQHQGNVISGWISAQHMVSSNQLPSGSESLQNISNALAQSVEQNVLLSQNLSKQAPVGQFTEKEIETSDQQASTETKYPRADFIPLNLVQSEADKAKIVDPAVKLPVGASVADRSKRFSRDRLGAIIDSPFMLPVFTPSLFGGANKDANTSSSNEALATLGQIDSKSIFTFPPSGNSWMAAVHVPGPSGGDSKRKDEAGNVVEKASGDPHSKNRSSNSDQSSGKRQDGSMSSCSSIGNIPEDLLQNEFLINGLSNMPSLPVLNLPSAGWANDSVHPFPQQQPSAGQLQPVTVQSSFQTETDDSITATSSVSLEQPEATSQPLMQAPARKKRKIANADIANTKPRTSQKQIRFHNFTPSDFANGEVNVSQYKKPGEYASNFSVSLNDTRAVKRSRKSAKPAAVSQTASIEAAADKLDVKHAASEKSTSKLIDVVSGATPGFEPSSPSSTAAKEIPAAKPSTPSVVSTLPLQTPAVLKSASPKFKMIVPSTSEAASQSLPTPLQLNTPLFMHSSALLTPSSKLNSAAFLCRVSPGQLSSRDKASLQTPQFFNFSNAKFPYFFACDSLEQPLQKSSESSDTSGEKIDSVSVNRSHMTLNLSQKSGSDDSLQTPSKIPVVTPSAMLPNIKITPDLPPTFIFPSEKHLVEAGQEKQPEAMASGGKIASDLDGKLQPDAVVFQPVDGEKDEKESGLPSIVVDAPDAPVSGNEKSSSLAVVSQSASVSSDNSFNTKKTSKKEKSFVIPVDGPEQPSLNNAFPSSPLNTPALTQIMTPTISNLSHAGKSVLTPRPQSLFVTSMGSTTSASSSSQISTPTFYQLVSPSQGTSPSPFVLLSYPQKNMMSFANGSLLSPAFGIVQRPNSGVSGSSSTSLLKSALINKRAVFQFPPTTRSGTSEFDSSPVKEAASSNELSKSESNPEPEDHASGNEKARDGNDREVFDTDDVSVSESEE